MKSLIARWCGHTTQLFDLKDQLHRATARNLLLSSSLTRTQEHRETAERRLKETTTELASTRQQRDDLTELVQDQVDRERVIDLLINAKRVSGLTHSGPALARQRIDMAINLLREGK